MEKRLVLLVGGHSDGERIFVEPTRLRLCEPYDRTEQSYEAGEWGTDESPPVVTNLVQFDVYERVDEETFRYVEAVA